MSGLLALDASLLTPLRQAAIFRKVFVANRTACWPGGIEIDPEVLYERSVPEGKDSLAKKLKVMPDVGTDEDFCREESGVTNGQLDMPDDEAASGYPVDVEWENMPEVGLERWPYFDQEKNGK